MLFQIDLWHLPILINYRRCSPKNVVAASANAMRLWYFDKRQGELRWRILGIAPAAPDVNFIDSDDEANKEPIGLFWVFYPEIRDILYEAKAFNNYNSAVPVSFDHLLNTRRFSGLMYKEENVYGDREVKDYIADNALMQLLESERIREKIRNFEQDMWSY